MFILLCYFIKSKIEKNSEKTLLLYIPKKTGFLELFKHFSSHSPLYSVN